MTPHVLMTAHENNLPVIWCVFNDYSWGAIKGLQNAYFDAKEIATSFAIQATGELWNPDFALMARACGCEGEQVRDPADLAPALERAVKSNKPYLLDLLMDRNEVLPFTGSWQMPPVPIGPPVFGEPRVG
jgi:acetolactate synthase-1/2/3 large subunit